MTEPNEISPDSEPQQNPDPKVYAPFLVLLESEHPTMAPCLIGIGDGPCEFDRRKTKVRATFQTEAGTQFSGRYITEPSTSRPDAQAFLSAMFKKFEAVTASDKQVLGEAPPREQLGLQGTEGNQGPTGVRVQAEPEPEPATPPDEDEDAAWGSPAEPTDPSSERP